MALPPHLQEMARRVSNWGRWGPDDRRGTLNLIDAAAVLRGVAEAREGKVFGLAIRFDANGPQTGGIPGRTNPDVQSLGVNVSYTGDPSDFTTSDDAFTMGSQAATHWDALGHVGYDGLLYNGVDAAAAVSADGASQLGIENVGPIVTRGVLLDIARLHGVDRFEDGYSITGDDLESAAARVTVQVEPGDIVMVRTGQMGFLPDRERYNHPSPGLSTRSIEWIRDHDVAGVATDTVVFEVWPCEDRAVLLPVHMIHLRDMGLLQGQIWALDELAADCASDGRATCLLTAAPLPLTGAVGAPVVPVAVK